MGGGLRTPELDRAAPRCARHRRGRAPKTVHGLDPLSSLVPSMTQQNAGRHIPGRIAPRTWARAHHQRTPDRSCITPFFA